APPIVVHGSSGKKEPEHHNAPKRSKIHKFELSKKSTCTALILVAILVTVAAGIRIRFSISGRSKASSNVSKNASSNQPPEPISLAMKHAILNDSLFAAAQTLNERRYILFKTLQSLLKIGLAAATVTLTGDDSQLIKAIAASDTRALSVQAIPSKDGILELILVTKGTNRIVTALHTTSFGRNDMGDIWCWQDITGRLQSASSNIVFGPPFAF
ncbi:hypothetical protein MMC14_008968, partial [Varicellaria rhodocarpa]|nr:hypothetical protein [Varicellaria rhodocarpa]